MTIQATYFTKDQNQQDETTIYWFTVIHSDDTLSGEYGVADCNGERRLLDCDGCPCTDDHHWNEILENCVITEEMINDY